VRLLSTLAAALLHAGCAGAGERGGPAPADRVVTPVSNVDVDTPALREQKQQAGIEDCPAGTAPLDDPDALPKVVLPCLGGGPEVNLNELRGPMVVNLWAQWCEPCRAELPYYQRLHEESPGGVRVLGIDYLDTQPDGALELADDSGVTFPQLADPSGSLREELRIRALPGVLFVDEGGRVRHLEFTRIDSYRQLLRMTERYLDIERRGAG
jgi:thiol-disulfide isomerase/thioredoxin